MSTRQFGKKIPDISISGDPEKIVFGSAAKHYVELDDLTVDQSGRVSSSPDARPDSSERHDPNWPV